MLESIQTAIILAAGQGKRMRPLTLNNHKSLLRYRGETFIRRLVRQLLDNRIAKIFIVIGYLGEQIKTELADYPDIVFIENDKYEQDINIYSLSLALERVDEPFILLEADTIIDDDGLAYVTGNEFGSQSVWFTNNCFNASQSGGILKAGQNRQVIDLKIVPEYESQYEGYKKLTGLMRIGNQELPIFRKLIQEYSSRSIAEYYLVPWIENLTALSAIEADLKDFCFATFNTVADYEGITNGNLFEKALENDRVDLVAVNELRHIEAFDPAKVDLLVEKIAREKFWTRPIYIDRDNNLVLDGQHRLEVAKRLNLRLMPVQKYDYSEVEIWSLRREEVVTHELVIQRALAGDIYPYKTVKHNFLDPVTRIKFDLKELA
jgi:choline kinase